MTPTWYDILGVSTDATPAEIKAAWRSATDKFEPGQGSSQFRMFNEAADVLLDPDRRAEYDASLATDTPSASTEPDASAEPVVPATVVEEPAAVAAPSVKDTKAREKAEARERKRAEKEARRAESTPVAPPRPVGLTLKVLGLAVLPLLAVAAVVVGIVYGQKAHDDSQVDAARTEAPAAAQRAMTAVLSYDYRHMDADRNKAVKFLTPSFKKDYVKNFNGLLVDTKDGKPGAAITTKTVVTSDVVGTAVMDAEPDKVRVLVFANQTSKKGETNPVILQNRASVTMLKRGSSWLVDDIRSY